MLWPVEHQSTEQSSHFRDRKRNQVVVRNLFFDGNRKLLLARITDKNACANIDNVMCRCQPVQLRTSYSSSPVSCLACSKHSSITQREPAICTSFFKEVPAGACVK